LAGSVLRAPTELDIPAIVGCFATAFGTDRPVDENEVASWLADDEMEPDLIRVLEIDGKVVGYCDLLRVARSDELEICLAAQDHESTLLNWAEDLARRKQTGGTRAYIPVGHTLEVLLHDRGYRYWVSSLTMRIELEGDPPPSAAILRDFVLRTYERSDNESLIELLNAAFRDDPFFREFSEESFRARLLSHRNFNPLHWHVAVDHDDVAGVSLSSLDHEAAVPTGHINFLAVRGDRRRRGIGESLLRRTLGALHASGMRRVELGVTANNPTGAVRLYERIGMTAVSRWDNWVLRFNVS
jgi:ribosomal protein S18 acetylase RimI-like enzyme